MNDTTHHQKPAASPTTPSAWPIGLASLSFAFFSLAMFELYGLLHWQLLFENLPSLSEQAREPILSALDRLSLYRLASAALAAIWAIWCFRYRPRWLAIVALTFALLAVTCLFILT